MLADLQGQPTAELRVALGRDMRLSAPTLAERYARGMTDEGADVLDIGMVGTEMLYWTVGSRELDGGLMCTASHNPKAYTGAKLVKRGALALSGDSGIGELREHRDRPASPASPVAAPGAIEHEDVADAFREAALAWIDADAVKPLKVVLDGGNGMAGPMVGPAAGSFPLERIETYWTPDGEFPDHEPNPLLEENRRFIVDKVRERAPSWASPGTATPTAASSSTTRASSSTATSSPRCWPSRSCARSRARRSSTTCGRAARCATSSSAPAARRDVNRVGHAFFKTRMRETGAAFGGEVSGHYYFRDFYCADSGTLPALLILELLSIEGKRLAELLAPLRESYFISGEINSEVADQQAKMDEIAERYADGEMTELDGVSVDYDDWHFNVRPSNTEPLLRLNLESLVSPRAHGGEARRGARPDPLLRIAAAAPSQRPPAAPSSPHPTAPIGRAAVRAPRPSVARPGCRGSERLIARA